jgi:hypothetical protein
MTLTKEGQITCLNKKTLDVGKTGSIFNLKSEDYIDIVLIKSRENFLFTIEKQKIEFFHATTFRRSDSWDYFMPNDIVRCDKNKEGSKICISDKGGFITLFNFLKHLQNQPKATQIPVHKRNDPVVCIDVTHPEQKPDLQNLQSNLPSRNETYSQQSSFDQ